MAATHCPACGGIVESVLVRRDGQDVQECAACGLRLDATTSQGFDPFREVLFAEDSDLLRLAVEDVLLDKKLARVVSSAPDGQAFLETFTKRLRDGRPVDLVVLDVQMPVMTGFNAAVAMRAIERAFGHAPPTPIVFFSSQPCDERARKVLDFCGRALYVNKVASPNLAELASRVEQVLRSLLTQPA